MVRTVAQRREWWCTRRTFIYFLLCRTLLSQLREEPLLRLGVLCDDGVRACVLQLLLQRRVRLFVIVDQRLQFLDGLQSIVLGLDLAVRKTFLQAY